MLKDNLECPKMELRNLSKRLTYLLKEEPLSCVGPWGLPSSQTRMGVRGETQGGVSEIQETHISTLTLGQEKASDVRAGGRCRKDDME